MAIFGNQIGKIDEEYSHNSFYNDVIAGFSAPEKHLSSKYFYDDTGDKLFQQIMKLNEYYLPECELEIIQQQALDIFEEFPKGAVDLIELGAGDGSKTVHLLKQLNQKSIEASFYPLDISSDVLATNKKNMLSQIPGLNIHPVPGDYFKTLGSLSRNRPRVIMFMGSNIGNYERNKAIGFMQLVHEFMHPDDVFLVGIDLRKNPRVIRNAYDDKKGITRKFNLNLLERINRELDAKFDISKFDHYPQYDPVSGIASSYIVSLDNQVVRVGDKSFSFKKHELIHTEVSNKYSLKEIEQLGIDSSFTSVKHFLDSKSYFTISLFKK